jgi:hypothetical protein
MSRLQAYLDELIPKTEPVFRPTAVQGLLNPPPQAEAKPYSPETFSLLATQPTVAKQLGLLGLAFAPGAGFSDYAGTYPSAQGGTEPSAQQNWQQGNYITAGLQGLGAFGDAATLSAAALGPFAPLAAGVGMVAKAPRAAQRGVDGLIDTVRPKLDDLGFFSQVERSVMDIPQQKGTGQQFLAQIQKTPGVKPEELQYTGLDTFLANKPTVTKAEIQDYLDTNRVQVREVTLGVPDQAQITNQLSGDVRDILEAGQVFDDDAANFLERYQSARLAGRRDRQSEASLEEYLRNAGDNRTISEIEEVSREMAGDTTKFSQYTIPGGTNYREVLLTLPEKTRPVSLAEVNAERAKISPFLEPIDQAQYDALVQSGEVGKVGLGGQQYRSSHFDQPNILAHMRINDRTIDGKPTMFIEEVQSDWHQAGRKKGYGTTYYQPDEITPVPLDRARAEYGVDNADLFWHFDVPGNVLQIPKSRFGTQDEAFDYVRTKIKSEGVPDAPFKSTWDELSLKRAIKMASDEGYEQIAFTTGKTQADRYDLSQQVRMLVVSKQKDQFSISGVDVNDKPFSLGKKSADELSDAVGKELAEKIVKQQSENASYSGKDLVVGGEGMKGFYDKMLPKKLEKIGKKYGAKPTKTTMQTPDGEVEVWTFSLPKEMRDTVKEQGQPLFQIGAGAAGLGTAGLLATEEERM